MCVTKHENRELKHKQKTKQINKPKKKLKRKKTQRNLKKKQKQNSATCYCSYVINTTIAMEISNFNRCIRVKITYLL